MDWQRVGDCPCWQNVLQDIRLATTSVGIQELGQDVLPLQPVTTKPGKPWQRMIWTTEMNIDYMRCYFTATHLKTITTGYRFDLHRLFINQYPHLADQITEQRLIDQKRVIIKNNTFTAHVRTNKTKSRNKSTCKPKTERNWNNPTKSSWNTPNRTIHILITHTTTHTTITRRHQCSINNVHFTDWIPF